MRIEFVASDKSRNPAGGAVAVMAFEGGKLSTAAEDMDKATGGAVSRAIAAGRFAGKPGQTVELLVPAGLDAQRLVIVGAGPDSDWGGDTAERFAAQAFQTVKASGAETLYVMVPGGKPEEAARGPWARQSARVSAIMAAPSRSAGIQVVGRFMASCPLPTIGGLSVAPHSRSPLHGHTG